uniref:peroxidase n=1 Tax=Glycine max TaxID=3847 RepID=I1MP42_SOYBN
MARVSPLFHSLLLISSLVLASQIHVSSGKLVPGLSWNYYLLTCPKLERIIRKHLEDVFEKDSGVAPGILRLFFHDCFPNLGGPDFDVPLGRKDGLGPNATAPDNLPAPFFRTDDLLRGFGNRGFDATDVVALSGAHTYGRAHCPSLVNRTIETDPPIDPNFNNNLIATCPNAESPNTVNLDVRTPVKFDNMYYINLLNRQGVFTSDQDIAGSPKTKEIVNQFASDQKLFFKKFSDAFVKVSQLDVITDRIGKGEIRDKCFVANKRRSSMASVVEEVVELAQEI